MRRGPTRSLFGPLRTFVLGGRIQDYLAWRNANTRHPGVLAARRRERPRVRSQSRQRWGPAAA
jgi:hypothetical protein